MDLQQRIELMRQAMQMPVKFIIATDTSRIISHLDGDENIFLKALEKLLYENPSMMDKFKQVIEQVEKQKSKGIILDVKEIPRGK